MRCLEHCCRLAALTILGLAGCVHTSPQSDLTPERPEEYNVPPPGLYTKPPDYPKQYMNQFPGRKDPGSDDVAPVNPGMQRMGNASVGRPY